MIRPRDRIRTFFETTYRLRARTSGVQSIRSTLTERTLLAMSLAVAAILGYSIGSRSIAPVSAQAETTFEIIVHSGAIGVRTTSLERPYVRVYVPSGGIKIALDAPGTRPGNGRWNIPLTLGGGSPPVLVQPGDRVEATLGEAVTSVVIPEITATSDQDTDVVSGRVLGPGTVYVVLHRDGVMFEGDLNPDAILGESSADGTFEISVAGSFDLRPGTWGEVAVVDEASNVFGVGFAPPFARIQTHRYMATLRADGALRPTVALLDGFGTELSRGTEAVSYGNGTFRVTLARGGDAGGAFLPKPGEQFAIVIDGKIVANEAASWYSATVDPDLDEVRGHGPPGSRLVVAAYPDPEGASSGLQFSTVGDDGKWRMPVPSGVDLTFESQAGAEVWSGGAFVQGLYGLVPFVQLNLFDNQVSGTVEGRGELELIHYPADGGEPKSGFYETTPLGEYVVPLFDGGDERAIGSGDRLELRSETGEVRELIIPDVSVTGDVDRRGIKGQAPPGARVYGGLYPYNLNLFGINQFDRDATVVEAYADESGAFALRCPAVATACGTRYGYVTVYDEADRYLLLWIDGPATGVAITRANAIGFASSGSRVTVKGDGIDGVRRATSRPRPEGRLPGWEMPLNDVHPDGLPLGARFEISTDDSTRELVIPRFEWSVNTRTNTVYGSTDLVGLPLTLVAYSNGEVGRAVVGSGRAVVDAGGEWSIRLAGFNLLPGDDIEMYVIDDDYFLQWHETGVEGPDEATRVPPATATAVPTAAPTAVPTFEPTPERAPSVYLPAVRRE